jgi:fumarylacetoacetase
VTAGSHGPGTFSYGVFRSGGEPPRVGARRGERVIDLAALARAGGLPGVDERLLAAPVLNPLLEAGPAVWSALDETLGALSDPPARALDEVEPVLPIAVADYVDFYSSRHHATNVGRMFRPDREPLPRNWLHLPVAYHGRAGTVVVSGTPVRRPRGQLAAGRFGPSERLDVELELAAIVGVPSRPGEPVPVERALNHVFGLVLLNDWSARDIQSWEYQPLGPFLGKSFATSIGAWLSPLDSARRVAAPPQEPEPLPYLREEPWVFDLDLELALRSAAMAAAGEPPAVIARTSTRHLYWSLAQQIAHLTSNGAHLRAGDLLGSGTISGPEPYERGCLLELTWNGAEPLRLPDGSERAYLEDGDEVVLRGTGLADVSGTVEPSA